MAAARARARVEAAKVCTTFVERETEVILEKAKLKAKLRTLQREKVVASTEAEVLESVAAELQLDESGGDIMALPHEPAKKRTSDYVDCISATHHSQLTPF